MEEPKDWLIKRLMSGIPQEDAQQISRLIYWLDCAEEEKKNSQYEASLNAAMLADICEIIFGENANGAPGFMSYAHAGWACGPMSKPEDSSYVQAMLNHNKKELNKDTLEKIKEWENFLNSQKLKLRL